MSTQKETTQTNQFDPTGMSAYQGIAGSLGKALPGIISNPFGNKFFQLTKNNMMRDANNMGANNNTNLAQLFRTSGMGGSAGQGFMSAQQARTGRANSSLRASAGTNAIMSALNRQMQGMQIGSGFSPLQTGSQAVQKTTGLGTWLPQLLGAGLSGAMALGTGGGSMTMGSLLGGAGGVSSFFGGPSSASTVGGPAVDPSLQFAMMPQ